MVWVLRYFKFEQSEFLKFPDFDVNNGKNNNEVKYGKRKSYY